MIHHIAMQVVEHRADLLRPAIWNPEDGCQIYWKNSYRFEEYANGSDVIYFHLEPGRWDPETSKEMLDLAQLHNIALPDWSPDRMIPSKTSLNK